MAGTSLGGNGSCHWPSDVAFLITPGNIALKERDRLQRAVHGACRICLQQIRAPQDAHDAHWKTASQSRIGAKSGLAPLLKSKRPVRTPLANIRSNKKV